LKWSYENAISGEKQINEMTVQIPVIENQEMEHFETAGVHKAIILTQYINLCRAVLAEKPITQKTGIPTNVGDKTPEIDEIATGGEKLASQVEIMEAFKDYYTNASELLQDTSMKEEMLVFDKLILHFKKT